MTSGAPNFQLPATEKTLLDWFAGMAMQGLLVEFASSRMNEEQVATLSYRMAVAMFREGMKFEDKPKVGLGGYPDIA